MAAPGGSREVLFEMRRAGSVVRVTAIDPETGEEAVAVGPASAGEAALKALAIKKLDYVQHKKRASGGDDTGGGGRR